MAQRTGQWLYLLTVLMLALPVAAAEGTTESTKQESANTAPAEPVPLHPMFDQKLRLTLGAFYASLNNIAALGPSGGGAGVAIDFNNALGLSDYNVVGEASLHWRFASRWRLDLDYFNINRSATKTLTQDIEWGDNTITAGTTVDTSSKFSDLRVAVGYSFFQRQDKEIGLGLGLHVAESKSSIAATGSGGAASSNITAPLPVLVFYANFALTDTWAMGSRLDYLSLSYDDYSGEIRAVAIDFIYQPYKHVGFGFGWHSLSLRLDAQKPNAFGMVQASYQGPAAFVSLSY